MQHKKKAYTIAIITILTLSIVLAAIPMVSAAISAPTLTPSSGYVGDSVRVNGTGASLGGLVEVFWETTASENKLNETYATGAGIYECNITIPEDVQGLHYIIVKDVISTASNTFTVNPEIELTPTSGIPDDSVDVSGTGFAANGNITLMFMNATPIDVTPTPQPEANSLGSFSATFEVPTVDYGTYPVNATDDVPNTALANFIVGATITLTPVEGPTGKVVTIAGRGFNTTAGTPINITVGGVTAPLVAPINTTATGTFEGEFIVPTLAVGIYNVNATDGTSTATVSFKVTGTTWIGLTPTSGQPTWSVTIEGVNFTAIADTEVTVKFAALTVKTLYTNATGGFLGTFTVPSLPTAEYVVNATDANDLTATANFTIAITFIALNPTEGPTGTNATITGYGFTTGGTANVTIDTELVLPEDIPVADLHAGNRTFIVPTLPVGTYTVTATDSGDLTASASFQVTKTTELILTPSSAPVNYNVTVEANYFTAVSGKVITFIMKNATWNDTLTVSPTDPWTAVETNATGSFKGTFLVPSLALGNYIINATDANGLTVEVPFSVVEVTIEVSTAFTEYLRGDTISFSITSTFAANLTLEIEDPTGYKATDTVVEADYVQVDTLWVASYQYTLASDAPLGEWNWTATVLEKEKTGTFLVAEKPTLAAILDRIEAIEAALDDLESSLATLAATAATTADVDAVSDAVALLDTTVSNLQDSLAALSDTAATTADVDAVSSAVSAVSSDLAAVSTAVAALGTTISDLESAVEAVSETAATKTAVETLNTYVLIAVVLALISAIAAIASVVLIRQKIAG